MLLGKGVGFGGLCNRVMPERTAASFVCEIGSDCVWLPLHAAIDSARRERTTARFFMMPTRGRPQGTSIILARLAQNKRHGD